MRKSTQCLRTQSRNEFRLPSIRDVNSVREFLLSVNDLTVEFSLRSKVREVSNRLVARPDRLTGKETAEPSFAFFVFESKRL